MKTCFRCGESKPLDEFYRDPRMDDGHLGKCKVCTRRDVRANRAAKVAQYREYDRRRSQTPARRADLQRHKTQDPLKLKARVAVDNALRRGKLTKKPCEVCGEKKVEAHHDDYTKPLEVRWLCRRHHVDTHFPAVV